MKKKKVLIPIIILLIFVILFSLVSPKFFWNVLTGNVSFPEKYVKGVAYGVMGIAILSYFGLLVNGFFKIGAIGFLPPQYFGAIIIVAIVVLAIPSLRNAIISPQKADLKNSYRILYGMNVAFILGNAIIFFILP